MIRMKYLTAFQLYGRSELVGNQDLKADIALSHTWNRTRDTKTVRPIIFANLSTIHVVNCQYLHLYNFKVTYINVFKWTFDHVNLQMAHSDSILRFFGLNILRDKLDRFTHARPTRRTTPFPTPDPLCSYLTTAHY